jgi:N-acetylmuramic acid 6-phosphate etherase
VKKRTRPNRALFDQLRSLTTEGRNAHARHIDSASVVEILRAINRGDRHVPVAVAREIPYIAKAVNLVVTSLKIGGRLIYAGAGTSGRLGVLDAAECPPTFGTDPALVQAIIAGGKKSVFRSQEGAEDRADDGRRDIRKLRVGRNDVVCGITASTRTPYVVSAIAEAKRRGAATIYITTNPRSVFKQKSFAALRKSIDVAICPVVGPEIIMGSTRMKSGTAQKLVLNMITTAAMIRLGKVYSNMMVDLRMNSQKLAERAKRVLTIATGVDYQTADRMLREAGGHVKTAIVMIVSNISARVARDRLRHARGFVRRAIENKDR